MSVYAGPKIANSSLVLALDPTNSKGFDSYENLLTYSQDIDNSIWTKTNIFVQTNLLTYSEPTTTNLDAFSSVSNATGATINGFANSIQFGDNSVQRYAYKQKTLTTGAHTISVYVQMDDASTPVPGNTTTSGDFGLVFENNLVTSTITTTLTSGSIYRISGTVTAVGTAGANFGVVKYTGSSSKSFRVTGYQLVQGTSAGNYRATTTTALPILYTGPNRTSTANKIVPTSTNAGYPAQFVTFSSGAVYTISWYIQSAELTSVMVGIGNAFGDTNMIVDLSTGTVTTPPVSAVSYFATSIGNSWWRIGFTKASVNTGAGGCYCFPRGTANSSDGIYSGGAQVESGSSVSTYYATTGTAKTRGSTLIDLSNNSNTSTLTNGPTYNTANSGTIVFDGVNDYINCGPVSQIGSSLTAFTASVWVKPAVSATSCILENGDNFVTNTFYIFQENALYFTFLIYDGVGYDAIYANYVYQTNTWYNLVGTWTSGNRINFYTNGVLAEGTRIGAVRTNVISGNKNLFAGIRPGATLTYPFAGSMSNIQLYNRALSATEIKQNFNALRGRFGI